MEKNERLYKEKKDPCVVWGVIATSNGPYPDWVVEYLRETAIGLLSIDKGCEDFPQTVVDTLGLKAISISKNHRIYRDSKIYMDVKNEIWKSKREKIWKGEDTLKEIYKRVGEPLGLEEGTVENIYKKMRSSINKERANTNKDEQGG